MVAFENGQVKECPSNQLTLLVEPPSLLAPTPIVATAVVPTIEAVGHIQVVGVQMGELESSFVHQMNLEAPGNPLPGHSTTEQDSTVLLEVPREVNLWKKKIWMFLKSTKMRMKK